MQFTAQACKAEAVSSSTGTQTSISKLPCPNNSAAQDVVQPHSGVSGTVPLSHPGLHTQPPRARVIQFSSRCPTSAVKPQPRYICCCSMRSSELANQSCSCSKAISSQSQRFKIRNSKSIAQCPAEPHAPPQLSLVQPQPPTEK